MPEIGLELWDSHHLQHLPQPGEWKIGPTGPPAPVYCNRYFQDVLLTQAATLRTNLSVTCTTDEQGQPEIVAIITDQIACHGHLREYGFRMSIEQSFRDDKSSGFDLQHTLLQHAEWMII